MPHTGTLPKGRPAAVGYLRRSTDRQEQSIPDQKRAVEAYAAEHGMRITRLYVDDAISGTSVAKRPAFQEMVADAQAGRGFRYVLVYDVKRFGRLDNDEAGYYRHVLRQAGVEVCYASENFTGDSTDDLLRPVKQWQARQESKDLSKVTIRGQLSRVEAGWWMGGAPPYGYDLEYVDERQEVLFRLRFLQDGSKEMRGTDGALIRALEKGESISVSKRDRARLVRSSSERVRVVQRVFEMTVEEGRGLRSVADALNRDGIPSPRGPGWARIYSGKWSQSTIRSLLTNPHYVGDLVWNRRTDARFFKISGGRAVERPEAYGARLEPNDESDWVVIRDTHEPLVPREVWAKAASKRRPHKTSGGEAGRVTGGWKGKRARFLLSGLVKCGRCGSPYVGCHRLKGRPKKDGTRVKTYYYACGGYIRHGRSHCAFGPIAQEELEADAIRQVLDGFAGYLGPQGKARFQRECEQALGAEWSDGVEARDRASGRLQAIEEETQRLLDSLSPANRDHVDNRLQALDSERTVLERRLEELALLGASREDLGNRVSERWEFLVTLESVLTNGTCDQRKRAIRRAVADATADVHPGADGAPWQMAVSLRNPAR